MSEEVWKYLPHVPKTFKKPLGAKKKAEFADKATLNIAGGLFPVRLHSDQVSTVDSKWICAPLVQKGETTGPIYQWVKEEDQQKLYHGEKFNVEPQVLRFSEQEFNQAGLHQLCPYQRASEVFQLLSQFGVNFVVLQDRMPEEISIEELKEIFFTATRGILTLRGAKAHPLAVYNFDSKYEVNRKFELEKYMMRNKLNSEREKNLINEVRRLEILLKKEEREQINLKKALRLDQAPEEALELEAISNPAELRKAQRVFTRQQYLMKPLYALPDKIQERLIEVMQGMNIPDRIIATETNVSLFNELRKSILLMFSQMHDIHKKTNELRVLEEKKKRMTAPEKEDEKRMPPKPAEPVPKKKFQNTKG